jgi:hypothetical protein
MTLLAVKPQLPQPDIGAVLDVLAHKQPVEFHCDASPVDPDPFEVESRTELEQRLETRFPFRAQMFPVRDPARAAVGISLIGGPPIYGEGDSLDNALASFLNAALVYVGEWERTLRFGVEHQKYWGWVYRLMLAGDDEHILATLLDRPID